MLSEAEQKAWIEVESKKIYRVLSPPPAVRVHFVREARAIKPGDYGWGAPQMSPPEMVGRLIALEGTDEDYGIIWLADFLPEGIEFVATKPPLTAPNPHAVQRS